MNINMTNENLLLDEILVNKKNEYEEISACMFKEEFSESCDESEDDHFEKDSVVGGCDGIISQDSTVKEEIFGDIFMKEEIKEEDMEDMIPLLDQAEDRLDSQQENSSNAMSEPILQTFPQEEKEIFGDIFMKEEIKEEDMIPLLDQAEDRLNSQQENSANAMSEPVVQTFPQEKKIECLPSNVIFGYIPLYPIMLLLGSEIVKNSGSTEEQIGTLEHQQSSHISEIPFKCTTCSYQVAEKTDLETHERTDTSERPIKFCSCPYQARNLRPFSEHQRTHPDERPYKCGSCSYQTTQKSCVKKHERTHTGERPYKCGSCSYRSAQQSSLTNHERTHTGEKPFKCSSCSYRARQYGTLKRHERTHSGEKTSKCSQSNSETLLRSGIVKKNSCSTEEQIGTLECQQRSHISEIPFKGTTCSYQVAQRTDLKTHERTDTSEIPIKCCSCPYQARNLRSFSEHQRTHPDERPYKCGSCSYRAAQRSSLINHERTHTGEKPYKCSSCSYQATQFGTLQRHKRTHTGEKPFKCDSCSYRSTQLWILKKHKRTHTCE